MTQDAYVKTADQFVKQMLHDIEQQDTTVPRIDVDNPAFDPDQLAKHLRKIWVNWARNQPDAPVGWLVDYEKQNEQHREVQRLQATALFRMGYLAACQDVSATATKHPLPNRHTTLAALSAGDARWLLAGFLSLVTHQLKRLKVPISKATVERITSKLEPLADINMRHVDYFVPDEGIAANKAKPKWKKRPPSRGSKPERPARSMSDFVRRK